MTLYLGRDICNDLNIASQREWLVTNGIGGFACGTISGILTRRYHGLLIAALKPPLGRTLLLSKLEEIAEYNGKKYELSANRWIDGLIHPQGYLNIENFCLKGTIPVWRFACGDAIIEKRIWMQQGENTTYIQYRSFRSTKPIYLTLNALVNYRDYHQTTTGYNWKMDLKLIEQGVKITAYPSAIPFYLFSEDAAISIHHTWYYRFDLAVERYRGLNAKEDHLHGATFEIRLEPEQTVTLVATTEPNANIDSETAYLKRHHYKQELLNKSSTTNIPTTLQHLILAADQFIVDRPLPNEPDGKTIIAGYPWFSDWGRDTMISLPGLTLATHRPEIARTILRTFAYYLDQGMLPNVFPDGSETPAYNTVDATLWYFEAIHAYYQITQDRELLQELFPALVEVIEWHKKGTRYNIHLDSDGLIYAGVDGVQLTWMDAKVGTWVVTPRIGKPIEISVLWYNTLGIMAYFAEEIGQNAEYFLQMAQKTAFGFNRFWNETLGYCYDVLDSPDGNDSTLRPNQIFAVSLPNVKTLSPLLSYAQREAIVNTCGQKLLTSYGLRSLSPDAPQYKGQYGGAPRERDGAYHQGTVWGWLLGPFIQAHLKVYQNPTIAKSFLEPMLNHLQSGCVGSLGEIFDGDAPMTPRGAFAQAWTVAEVLRVGLLF
ncbi:glycogen debranching protein [Aphanothece hegewaldii CCALA 016]|uniref:Glycogen debranching protein n=1 Tax=Aphanothece hegewaldii CCALA 016 TaxID=2107694 RepID=A0A2T1LVD6_9CHRO|nr:amylo-alpha-1,6-glucosidase [Aphanothece hegewaldii]PSF35682.1 glycogen debranching protein [Aphanothece hegewaldii CCALA 016]